MPTLPPCGPLRAGDPRRLGRYALVGRLGRGSQGVVYLGRTADGRMVAVKLLHADRVERPGARKRLAKEAASARRIRGRCTARIIEVDAAGPRPYIVTEYVPGPSLHRRVHERGPLSGAPLDRLMIGTATALVAIHSAGIVHRDLKPANVVLGPEGPRVIDFGVAHMDDAGATLTGVPVGTPAYMAPEQVAGEPAGGPADVFAWASTMVYAATGEAPFGRDTAGAVMNRVANHEPDLADLHGPVVELLRACLEKDPDERPSAEHILRRLLELSTRKPAGRSRTAMLAAGTRAAFSPADRRSRRDAPGPGERRASERSGDRRDPRSPKPDTRGGPPAGSPSTDRTGPKVPEWMRDRKPPTVRSARDLPRRPYGPDRARARDDVPPARPKPAARARDEAPRPRPAGRERARRPWAGDGPVRRSTENQAHEPGLPTRSRSADRPAGKSADRPGQSASRSSSPFGGMSAVRRHGYVIAVIITMLIGLALGLTSPWASSSSGSPKPSASATP